MGLCSQALKAIRQQLQETQGQKSPLRGYAGARRLMVGVRGGVGAERAEGAFPGHTARPRSADRRSDAWAQIQMNSELVGGLSGRPRLISSNFTEKTDASALSGRAGATLGRAGSSHHGAGWDARTVAMGLQVDCRPHRRGTADRSRFPPGERGVRVCLSVCVGKAGEAAMLVDRGVSVGKITGEPRKGEGPDIVGGAASRPRLPMKRPFSTFPPAPFSLTCSSPDTSLYLLHTVSLSFS